MIDNGAASATLVEVKRPRSGDRMKRLFASFAIVGIILTLSAPAAQAVKPDRFQPGPNPDLVVEDVCEFPVLLHDVVNQLVITSFFDRDGNLVRDSATGRIVEQITRLDDQGQPVRSITRNISGPGTFTFDGEEATLVATGPWLFFFFPGEVVGHPDGLMWLTTGRWIWHFDASGIATLVSHTGRFEDVCTLLA
jgi:hypothetical protein